VGATSAVGQLGFFVRVDRVNRFSVAGEGLFLEESR
jgi:hypothetical protein